MAFRNHKPTAIARARKFRREMGVTESIAWQKLRNNRLGFKFRRQVAIGPYVLDFYCAEARLAIELDGEQHALTQARDAARDGYFEKLGIDTLRIATLDLVDDRLGALELIFLKCVEHTGRNPRDDW